MPLDESVREMTNYKLPPTKSVEHYAWFFVFALHFYLHQFSKAYWPTAIIANVHVCSRGPLLDTRHVSITLAPSSY